MNYIEIDTHLWMREASFCQRPPPQKKTNKKQKKRHGFECQEASASPLQTSLWVIMGGPIQKWAE